MAPPWDARLGETVSGDGIAFPLGTERNYKYSP